MPENDRSVTNDFLTPELSRLNDDERISLCEVLDRVLNKGAVVVGEVTISVAGIDLVYLGLQLLLTSVETARESISRGRGVGLRLAAGKESSYGPH
jgi:gas vesicle structural protein